jgi:hypothetical protein
MKIKDKKIFQILFQFLVRQLHLSSFKSNLLLCIPGWRMVATLESTSSGRRYDSGHAHGGMKFLEMV